MADERKLDIVTKYLVENDIPLTQRNWLEAAFFGDKSSVAELGAEELNDLPRGFER